MSKPKPGTKLMAHLEQLITQGDYAMFFRIEKTMSPALAIWSAVKVRSIELLMEQGFTEKALTKASFLKNSLCSPRQRQHAELLSCYLTFLVAGRKKQDEVSLLQLIAKISDSSPDINLQLCAVRLQLGLISDKILTGQVDANLKNGLISDYKKHLETCLNTKLEHKAFTAVKEISQLLISKPLPMIGECLAFLKQCIQREFIAKSDYRKGIVFLIMAEISLEQKLNGFKSPTWLDYYKLADEAFTRAVYKPGSALVNESYGTLLLKYGKGRGKYFLDKVIHNYEQKGIPEKSLNAHNNIIRWLEKRGLFTATTGYRVRVNEISEATDRQIKPQTVNLKGDDLPTLATRLIYLNKDGLSSRNALPIFRQEGDTLHLARILGHLSGIDGQQRSLSKPPYEEAIKLYMKLGYKAEAATLIKDWLTHCATENSSVLSNEESASANTALLQIEKILNEERSLESQEILVASYQAMACLLVVSDERESIKHLTKAETILSKFGLIPQKALNNFYEACLLFESGRQSVDPSIYQKAVEGFEAAFSLFKISGCQEGMWRSLFGKAICLRQQLKFTSEAATLITQSCIESFRDALKIVYRLSEYHIRTYTSFGVPFRINPVLQADASQLFQTAIHFFSDTVHAPKEASKIVTKFNVWVLLNRSQSETQPN